MRYKVYCLKDRDENVKYVGMTSKSLEERFTGHKKKYKHRKDYHIELLHIYDDKISAEDAETYFIKYYDTVNSGENITYGVGRRGLGATSTSFSKGNKFGETPSLYFMCNETGDIGTAKELSIKLDCKLRRIYEVAKNKRKTTKGLSFSYVSKETFDASKAIPR